MTYINASIVGIVTALFAGSLGLSKGERWFLIAAFALHAVAFLLIYVFNASFVKKRLTNIESLYKQYTEKFVVLAEDELEEIKKTYIDPSVSNVNQYLNVYCIVTLILIALMGLLIWLGFYLPDHYFYTSSVTESVYSREAIIRRG